MPPQVLFVRNDPTAPEALLGDVFAECGFDIDTFEVVSADRVGRPSVEVEFPEPSRYDMIVPLGARWSVFDDSLPWITAEMDMTRRALDCGVGVLGVCFGGLQQQDGAGSARPVVPMALRSSDTALGVDADDLRARTAQVADDAAERLRQLVRGLLALGDGVRHGGQYGV